MVVGGGIVGMATAREIALRHPRMNIAVLEKENRLGNTITFCKKSNLVCTLRANPLVCIHCNSKQHRNLLILAAHSKEKNEWDRKIAGN